MHPQRFERSISAVRGRAGADALLAGLLGRPKQLPPVPWPLPHLATAERVLLAQLGVPHTGADGRFVALLGDAFGAYTPSHARRVLAELHAPNRRLLLCTDATRDPDLLRRAYDDPSGLMESRVRDALAEVAAAHDLTTLDQDAFVYRIRWDAASSCMELALTSTRPQLAHVAGVPVAFAADEPLVVARHHKHSTPALHALLALGNWRATRELARGPARLWLCDPI